MARKIRYIYPKLPHHALQRGNNRQPIFFDKEDRICFLSNLKKFSTKTGVVVGAYCLMTNHFHLLLYPNVREELIEMMKYIAQQHTQYINRKYGRSGKLWENRYKLNIVEPEYEWVIARYIEQNPVRAGMVKEAGEYKYSSARAHMNGEFDEMLGKDIIGKRREEYCEFIKEIKDNERERLSQIRATIQQEKALGGQDFMERLQEMFGVSFQARGKGRPAKSNNENK
ncbi:MAG: transposase [Candidatus Omnitrophota bacterium]